MRFFDEKGETGAVADLRTQLFQIFFEGTAITRFAYPFARTLRHASALAILFRLLLDPLKEALRTRGIVQIEDGRLRKRIRPAAACRMMRIALDLDRTAIDGRHD